MFFTPFCLPFYKSKNFNYNLNDKDIGIYKTGIVGDKNANQKLWENKRHVKAEKAKKIIDKIDKSIWHSYFKFTVIRNPWDMVVSMYFYRIKARNMQKGFCKFIKRISEEKNHNYEIYKINNEYICDYYIKYENLLNGIKHVCEHCKLENYNLDNFKNFNSNYRPKKLDYKEMYNQETKKLVEKLYEDYIEKFNYKF